MPGDCTWSRLAGRPAGLIHWALALACVLVLTACSSARVGLDHLEPDAAYRHDTASALSGEVLSNPTEIALRRLGLNELWERDRLACLAQLHALVADGRGGRDQLFALAETSYFHANTVLDAAPPRPRRELGKPSKRAREETAGQRSLVPDEARSHYLAAAVYAYAFLFPEYRDQRVGALDGRYRLAADLYAAGLAHAFANAEPGGVTVDGGAYPLPFGEIEIAFDENELIWGERTLADFRWSGSFTIDGLRNHYRTPGVGAAVVARTLLPEGEFDFVSPSAWVPATVFLRIDEPCRQLRDAELAGTLEVQTADERHSVEIGRHEVPLQSDASAALAATLEQSRFWESELSRFLGRTVGLRSETALTAQEPYVPGKIPAVFVHGTDSSPATWANMVNDLQYDQSIHDRYHFWFFRYDSGSPIMYSSMLLRRALSKAVAELSEDHEAHCLDDMIVIGHSQGGLLTKLTAVESGTALWDAYYRRSFDDVSLRPKARELMQEMWFVDPLPFVRRLVFIATPHHGSYLASSRIAQRLASRLIRLPGDVLEISTDVAGLGRYSRPGVIANRLPTSIDNMSPRDPFIRTSAKLPIAPGVPYDSIIALRPGESEATGGDGVVKFASAHIDGAESELVVASGHTTLSNPQTIEEVRRILALHAEASSCRFSSGDQ